MSATRYATKVGVRDEPTLAWREMNAYGWVYDGFDVTYKGLGVSFDKIYYESDTYLIGKE